ncbi:hypothetical protein SDJN02_13590, partial [Cucurbita argyrosperma subsp. argyrosperma]
TFLIGLFFTIHREPEGEEQNMATLYQDAEAWNAVSRFRRLSNVQSMASSTVLDYDEDDNATSPTISVMASCCM